MTAVPESPAAPAPATAAIRTATQRELGAVLLLIALGGAGALLCGGRGWATITAHRPRPLSDDVLVVSGHALHPAVSGFAVVALAAIVAILASGSRLRRVIGAVLVLAGAGVVLQGAHGLGALSQGRALELVQESRSGVGVQAQTQISAALHRVWPTLAVLAGVAIATAGLITLLRAGRWATLSRRYEAPSAAASVGASEVAPGLSPMGSESVRPGEGQSTPPAARDLALWNQLDRGEDPTA